jgi:hypothetical protein
MLQENLKNKNIVLPFTYFGSSDIFRAILNASEVWLEKNEHFIKQTLRNRCFICGPNGKQMLVIPIKKGKVTHTVVKDVCISYESKWKTIHWRSIEAGYRRSPYFEFYEDDLRKVFEKDEKYLIDFNLNLQDLILTWLKTSVHFNFTNEYQKDFSDKIDLRNKERIGETNEYYQVFASKNGFIKNVSIIDLIFNEGPKSVLFLK